MTAQAPEADTGVSSQPRRVLAVSAAGVFVVFLDAAARQLGAVLGVAGLVAVLGQPGRGQAPDAFHHGWVLASVMAAGCSLVALWLRGTPDAPAPPASAAWTRAPRSSWMSCGRGRRDARGAAAVSQVRDAAVRAGW